MPDLSQSLQGRDLGHLRIVAQLWGIDFDAPDARVGLQRLATLLLQPAAVADVVTDLPTEARLALDDLMQQDGRLPWPLFTRRYGALRDVGPARRDRDRPYVQKPSPAEMLWYRALVARAFFDTLNGPEEFAYIPEDLLPLIPLFREGRPAPLGRLATPKERAFLILANDHLLDDAATLLAALRLREKGVEKGSDDLSQLPGEARDFISSASPSFVYDLLSTAGLLDANGVPLSEPTRAFLEARRGEALAFLTRAWLSSAELNDLRHVAALRCDGEWQNDPLRARRAVLDFLSSAPSGWCSLNAFIADIHQHHPDFQRPAGDYDSWYIRESQSGEFLRGFEHWGAVDGALIQYLITGVLHWLGVLDLAAPDEEGPITAFRYSEQAAWLLGGENPAELAPETELLQVTSNARLRAPRLTARAVRYQVARFCEWDAPQGDVYRYHITPASLARARQQGLTINHLLALLPRNTETIPPNLVKALGRWEQQGLEATIEQATILRVSSPDLLNTLRASRAARFLGEPLGPTVIIVRPGAWEKVLDVLAELGVLGAEKIT